jgi:hypothetical protein
MKLMLLPPSLVSSRTIFESLRGDDAGECAELTAAMGRVCGDHSKKGADLSFKIFSVTIQTFRWPH